MNCLAAAATSFCGGGPSLLGTLQTAGNECRSSSETLQSLATQAREKSAGTLAYSQKILHSLQSFQKIDARAFVEIKNLIDQGKEQTKLLTDMGDLAQQSMLTAQTMTKNLQTAVDSIPAVMREEAMHEESIESPVAEADGGATTRDFAATTDENDESSLAKLLECIDQNVQETRSLSRGFDQVDIFTVASQGRTAFVDLLTKQNVCGLIFDKMQGLSRTILNLANALAMENASCCDQLNALAAGTASMVQCLRISKLLERAAGAAKKLLKALMEFGQKAWTKFCRFVEEFDAAKRLGRFVQVSITPLKASKVGQGAAGLLCHILGR